MSLAVSCKISMDLIKCELTFIYVFNMSSLFLKFFFSRQLACRSRDCFFESISKLFSTRRSTRRSEANRIGLNRIERVSKFELTIHSERHPLANCWRHVVAGDAEIRSHLSPLDTVEMQQRTVVVVVLLESATTCVHGRTFYHVQK